MMYPCSVRWTEYLSLSAPNKPHLGALVRTITWLVTDKPVALIGP